MKVVFNPFIGNFDFVPDSSPQPTPTNPNVTISNLQCDPSVNVGDIVRTDNGTMVQAQADSFSNSNAIGIIDSKESSTTCTLRVSGVTDSIYTNLDTAADYYLSDTIPGALTTIAPTASGTVILRIGQALSSTQFLVDRSPRILRS